MNGQLKVNVDELFLEGLGREGIRSIFRESGDRVLIQFGKEVVVDSMFHAELLALREDILVIVSSRWAFFHSFLLKSNSQSVVT